MDSGRYVNEVRQDAADEYRYYSNAPPGTSAFVWPLVLKEIGTDPQRICEIGCGNGSFSKALAARGHTVVAFDSSTSGVKWASRNAVGRDTYYCHDLSDPIRPEWCRSFDVVVALEVIEHLLLPRQLLRTAREVLIPGGRLILSTPYHGYLKNLALAVSGKWDQHLTAMWDHGHVKFFSRRTLARLLAEEGFPDPTIRGVGRLLGLWKSMIAMAKLAEAPE
jgi:2-polyprenyl-3-methyl-5-hydroxy-6-metoxy-1,4-benzoquinol methylase